MNLIFYHPPSSTKRASISILISNVQFFRVEDEEFPIKSSYMVHFVVFLNKRCSQVKSHKVTIMRPKNQSLESNKHTLGKTSQKYDTIISEIINFTMNKSLKVVLDPICPFAQRAWITLVEKKCDFQVRKVSIFDKEPFFTQTYLKAYGADLTSTGKVPILIDGEDIFCESDLVAWYVAQKFKTGNQLIPQDPAVRLKMRWFGSSLATKVYTAYYSFKGFPQKSEDEKKRLKEEATKTLEELQNTLVMPYAMGENFTLADVLTYPWIERWVTLAHFLDFDIDEKFKKIHEWKARVQERESIKASRQTDEYLCNGYKSYFSE